LQPGKTVGTKRSEGRAKREKERSLATKESRSGGFSREGRSSKREGEAKKAPPF